MSWKDPIQMVVSEIAFFISGEVPEWTKGTDCKSVASELRRFESSPPHHDDVRGNSSVGRALAFQAGCRGFESRFPLQNLNRSYLDSGKQHRSFSDSNLSSSTPKGSTALVAQSVEHILGKDEVTGSIPVKGFCLLMMG